MHSQKKKKLRWRGGGLNREEGAERGMPSTGRGGDYKMYNKTKTTKYLAK